MDKNANKIKFPLVENQALLIKASAGTGKTWNLCMRLIALLARGVKPEKILILTFTKKAAHEILTRVLKILAQAAISQHCAGEIARHVLLPEFSKQDAESLLRKILENFSVFSRNVSTFDAFFKHLVHRAPSLFKIPHSTRIATYGEKTELRKAALNKVFAKRDAREISTILSLASYGQFTSSVFSELLSAVDSIQPLLKEYEEDDWGKCVDGLPNVNAALEAIKKAKTIIPTLRKGADKRKESLILKLDELEQEIKKKNFRKIFSNSLIEKLTKGPAKWYEVPFSKEFTECLIPLLDCLEIALLQMVGRTTKALWFFGTLYEKTLAEIYEEEKLSDFSQIAEAVHKVMTSSDADIRSFSLYENIEHLLFDEFQDTSLKQWEIIRPIAEEVMANPGGSLFCVGDVKQAIFGWRGGLAEIFDSLQEQYVKLHSFSLQKNYRSANSVLKTTNDLFSNLNKAPCLVDFPEAKKHWGKIFKKHESAYLDLVGQCFFQEVPPAHNKELYINSIAAYIAEISYENPDESMGVLTRRNSTAEDLVSILNSPSYGLNAISSEGRSIVDSPEVSWFISLFELLRNPGETRHRLHLSQSPLGEILGFKDRKDDQQLEKIYRQIWKSIKENGYGLTVGQLVNRILDFASSYGELRLRQLVDACFARDLEERNDISSLLSHIREEPQPRVETSQISVSTIHKSKGLEYDIVVLAALETKLADSSKLSFLTCKSSSAKKVFAKIPPKGKFLCKEFASAIKAEEDQQAKESLALLYVAMTRAKKQLHFLLPQKPKTSDPINFARLIRELLQT